MTALEVRLRWPRNRMDDRFPRPTLHKLVAVPAPELLAETPRPDGDAEVDATPEGVEFD